MKTEEKALTVKEMIEKGIVELTILEGSAKTQYNPEAVEISGTITAPSIFVKNRDTDIKTSHCLVSKSEGTMKLVVNEQDTCNKFTVKGKVTFGKVFTELGINTGKAYDPMNLSAKLRLKRSIFKSPAEHTKIVNLLRNIEAKIDQEISNDDDLKGNRKVAFSQKVSSNIPDSITLKLPLIEGDDDVEIGVNVLLQADGVSNIKCYLESVDGAELIDNRLKTVIDEEVKKIESKVTVIFH